VEGFLTGITKADLDAQYAMLKRGDEKRQAAKQAEDRERLRDTFAAAALTGLLSNVQRYQNGPLTEQAFEIADFMLKERERHHIPDAGNMVENTTNHDAAPEAKATNDGRTPKDAVGTGNTPSKAEIDALEYVVEEGRTASIGDYGILRSWLIRLRPEWESQLYEESDEKRMNANTNREATRDECSVRGEGTLTDAEREALEFAVETGRVATHDTAILRTLLERLK
jgi:hypothetical protein